ncbi:MAG: hypothetical protein R3A13_03130 [Bdellovibrionota bacterium]
MSGNREISGTERHLMRADQPYSKADLAGQNFTPSLRPDSSPGLSRRRVLAALLLAPTFPLAQAVVSEISDVARVAFDVSAVEAAKFHPTINYPDELVLFQMKGTKVLVPKMDDDTGKVIVGKKGVTFVATLKDKKWYEGTSPKIPKDTFFLVARPQAPGSEITQSEVFDAKLGDLLIDNNGKLRDFKPVRFGLDFSEGVLAFVFQSKALRTTEQPTELMRKTDPHLSRLAVAIGLSTETFLPTEIATQQLEVRAAEGVVHSILVAHTSPSFSTVKEGKRPRSFYLETGSTDLDRKDKNSGKSAGRSDYAQHYRFAADYMLPPEHMISALRSDDGTELKPFAGLGVHEESYICKQVIQKNHTNERVYYNLSFWIFMQETPDGLKPVLRCRLVGGKSEGFSESAKDQRFPFAGAQSDLVRPTSLDIIVNDVKDGTELKPHEWEDPRNPHIALYGTQTLFNPFVLDKSGGVQITPRLAVYDPSHGDGRKAKAVSVTSKDYDPDSAKDSEHRFYCDQSEGQESSRSHTSPFKFVLDKKGEIVFRAGAQIHIAGHGFIELTADQVQNSIKEMIEYYDSQQDPKKANAAREAICCFISALHQFEGGARS